jgi:hypothetical protein
VGAIGEPKREILIPTPEPVRREVEPEPVTRPETPEPRVPVPAGS